MSIQALAPDSAVRRTAASDKRFIGLSDQMDSKIHNCLVSAISIATVSLPEQIPVAPAEDLDQYIANSLPFIFEKGASGLGLSFSVSQVEEILQSISDRKINVAQTPLGNADAPLGSQFVQPHIEVMTVSELLRVLETQEKGVKSYMQSQDDNLRKEFSGTLIPDSPKLPQIVKLLNTPDASNLWIGGPGTTSRLHCDNYDNIYIQLSGHKTIYLIPPQHVYGVHEQFLTSATYQRRDGEWSLSLDDTGKVLFPTVNPSDLTTWVTETPYCRIYKVTLGPGEALFMPALWYHQVETCACCGLNVSANYWYAPPEERPLWNNWSFMRSMSLLARGYTDPVYFEDM